MHSRIQGGLQNLTVCRNQHTENEYRNGNGNTKQHPTNKELCTASIPTAGDDADKHDEESQSDADDLYCCTDGCRSSRHKISISVSAADIWERLSLGYLRSTGFG